jgi:hypothetical protein
MSTTTEKGPGFEIQTRHYPWVAFDDWTIDDIRLVRTITGYNERQLLVTGEASPTAVNIAFAAVAFWHENPAVDESGVAKFIGSLNPAAIKVVGIATVTEDDDAGPPDGSGDAPSENGMPSSAATPETSDTPEQSGGQPSSPSSPNT